MPDHAVRRVDGLINCRAGEPRDDHPEDRRNHPVGKILRQAFDCRTGNTCFVECVGVAADDVRYRFAPAGKAGIVERIGNPIVVAIGSITFIVATMGINIVANFVSPAYDISNLYPGKIDFRRGGLITSILSVMVCPWIFVSSPQAITIFVSIFGAALGPMFGIMVADYYLVKRQKIVLNDLYTMSPNGSLHFDNGWNTRALIALAGKASSAVVARDRTGRAPRMRITRTE